MTKEKEEHDKLVYKYKKEVKGALREIRRDNTFLANLKFNETKSRYCAIHLFPRLRWRPLQLAIAGPPQKVD